ncbi:hypothetical protein Ddep01_01869 [Deinococcus depolymerans]|uniref:hypothetical protein n=1 Tax=Deinococcus depolymerans TaxID=392408 RepID=UPI0030A637C0
MLVAFINPDATLLAGEGGPDAGRRVAGLPHLLSAAELIPVSGLDENGLMAVPASFTSWQILLHGAVVITPSGLEDEAWRRLSLEAQRGAEQALELAHQAALHVDQLGQLGLDVQRLDRSGAPLLIRITHPHGLRLATEQAAAALRDWWQDSPFRGVIRLECTPQAVTVLPSEVRAERAVNYVMNQLDDVDLSVGVSALASDQPFLALCDYALMPGDSEWLNTDADEDPGT